MNNIITRCFLLCCILALPFLLHAQQPVAGFSATPVVGCAPLVVQFSDLSSGSPTSWQWNLGNGANSVLQNPSTTYTTPGTYTVTLTATNASGSNTVVMTGYITVYGAPIVDFTVNDTAGCPPHTVSFTDNSNPQVPGAATYSWSFGDGNFSSAQNPPAYTYSATGYYNITLIVTNSGGCVSSLTRPNYIHVYTPPDADFTAAATAFCFAPATADFTATTTGPPPYNYNWNFGDGNTGTGISPAHTYTVPGNYTVSLIITDGNGCKDTVVKPAYIGVGTITAGFTVPATACEGAPVSCTNISNAATSFIWDFGDGNTSAAVNPSHVYAVPGIYDIRLIAINGVCADTLIMPITVHPKPEAAFSFIPQAPCPAPATIQFTNQSVNGVSYVWSFGDGGTSTAVTPSHTYNFNTWYSVQLVATNSFGCKDTVTKFDSIRIHDLVLDVGAVPYQGCVPLSVDFFSARYTNIPSSGALYPYQGSTWYWDFGDGSTSADSTPTHIYTTPGNYTITLTVTTDNGCVVTDTTHVLVGTLPNTLFTGSPDIICVGGTVTFNNLTTGATAYLWEFGDGGSTGATNPTYTYNTSGVYTVTLHAYNNGCEGSYQIQDMITVLPPTALFDSEFNCVNPLLVTFDDAGTIGATSQTWDFGDGNTSTLSAPTHTYSATGAYNVTLITFNSVSGCSDTITHPIEVVDPVAGFVANDTAICRHDSITFQASYTALATQYNWYIGSLAYIDSPSVIGHRFPQNGIYTVSVVIYDIHGCRDTATRTNYILVATPEAEFTAVPPVGCTPLQVQFTDNSTHVAGTHSVTRGWDFGNGTMTIVNTPGTSSTYPVAGLYDISMIVTNNIGCSDTLEKQDYVDARQPVAAFYVNDTTACIGQPLSFSNTSNGTSLSASWDFGDGTTSLQYNPTHTYAATGSYTVRLIVIDPTGCTDTLIKTAYISISKPDASFTISDTLAICPPLNAIFTNTTTGGATYTWAFGNSTTSILQNPSSVYTDPGFYSITMIAMDIHGCKDTAYGTTHVLGYAGGLSYTPLDGCAPATVQFTATLTNVPSLVWDFNDGTTAPVSSSATTTHTYVTPGAYVPKLILSDGMGCLNSSDGLDTIKIDGVKAGFITSPLCEKTPISLEDTSYSFFSDVVSWQWDFNNGAQVSNQQDPLFSVNSPGTYTVTLITVNANGCADTLQQPLTIHPLPVITASGDTAVCPGDAARLGATGGVSYVWNDPGSTLSCTTCADPFASPVTATSYTVTGTDVHGCMNTDVVSVGMQLITISTADPGGEICIDSSIRLSAAGADRYEWKPAESLDNPHIPDPAASPQATTVYTVMAWEGSCPPDSHKVTVMVRPKPTVYAGADQTVIAGNSVMLQATGTLVSNYFWMPAHNLSCETCSNPTATPAVTTSYVVVATSTYGCRKMDTVVVRVLCDNSQLFIPNTFSPNGDGQNEVFFPRGQGLKEISSFRVYNRWGELVFERKKISLNDEANGWDGRYKGNDLSPDVFVYVVDGICDNGDPVSWKGDVTLLR